MSPRKKTAAPVFDITQFRPERRYVERVIDRTIIDEPPLTVRLQRLNMREVEGIPYSNTAPLADVRAAIAPYIDKWDLRAVNKDTGETIDVPPPSMIGGEVLELLDGVTCVAIASWLVIPHIMQREADEEKKDSKPSESIATHANNTDTTPA